MATQWNETIQGTQTGALGEHQGPTPGVRAQRSESRAAQTFAFFLRDLEHKGLERKLAEQAIESVLCTMEQRLMVDEARHLEAQLPRRVVALLERCPRHKDRPYQKLNRTQLLSMVAEDLGTSMEQAERITRMVLSTVRGALLLSGTGQLQNGRLRFSGQASAADGYEDTLGNMLNLLGQRRMVNGKNIIALEFR